MPILNTLLKKADILIIPIFDYKYVSDLLIKDETCFGAMTFNTVNSERNIFCADAVILCTGGHTRLWKKVLLEEMKTQVMDTTCLKQVVNLLIWRWFSFIHGMLFPEEMAGTLVTEAVREKVDCYLIKMARFMVNYDKERMERTTRDKVALANYTKILEGRGTPNGGVFRH